MDLFINKKTVSLFILVMLVVLISIPSFATVQPTVDADFTEKYAESERSTDTSEATPAYNLLILGIILILLFSVGLIIFKRD